MMKVASTTACPTLILRRVTVSSTAYIIIILSKLRKTIFESIIEMI
jgi:hypothetical protein